MKTIIVHRFKEPFTSMLVDDADYSELSEYRWNWHPMGYAMRGSGSDKHLAHRHIMQAPKGVVVDHIDGNRLNCQRSNLRLCTNSQNLMSRTALQSSNTSGYHGVRRIDRGGWVRWQASISVKRKVTNLGAFPTFEAALAARKKAEVELFGEFAPTFDPTKPSLYFRPVDHHKVPPSRLLG